MRFPQRSASQISPVPLLTAATRRTADTVPGTVGSPWTPISVMYVPVSVNSCTRELRPSATNRTSLPTTGSTATRTPYGVRNWPGPVPVTPQSTQWPLGSNFAMSFVR